MRSAFFVVMTTLAALNSVQAVTLNTSLSKGDEPAKIEEAKGEAKVEAKEAHDVSIIDTFFVRENPSKITDQELAAAFDQVDDKHDGVLEKSDLAMLLAKMGKDPNAGYVNYLWSHYKDHDADTIGF